MKVFYRLFTAFVIVTILSSQAIAAIVDNPANLNEVIQALKLYQLDKAAYEGWRRQVLEQNRLFPDSPKTFTLESLSDVVTLESMTEKNATVLRKYWAANYASLFIKEAQTPAAKLSLKLELLQNQSGQDVAKAEFFRLSPKDREAVNNYRLSVSYRSFINALNQFRELKGEHIGEWVTAIFNQRITTNRRMYAEFLEAFVRNNQADEKFDLLPYVKPPIHVGIRSIDAEFQLIYQIQKKKAEHMDNFNRLIPQNYIDKLLAAEILVDPVKVEASLLTLSEYDEYYQNLFKELETALDTYFQSVSSLPYAKSDRQARLQKEQNSMVKALNNLLKEAELARSLHEVTRKILNLSLQNKGRIKLSDKTLLFEDNATLIQYRSLNAELMQVAEQLVQFNKEIIQMNQNYINTLRS